MSYLKGIIVQISQVSNTTETDKGTTSPAPAPTPKTTDAAAPADTVHLSSAAAAKIAGGDKDGDGH